MLWLCLSLPALPLEALGLPSDLPTAVVERRGARRSLVSCSPDCFEIGVCPGLDAVAALARLPNLRLIERSKRSELHALQGLATWADQFTSFASFEAQRLVLWLEIGTSLRYFGGLDVILAKVRDGIASIGYHATLGVAPTLEAALVVARAGAGSITIEDKVTAALSPLPIDALSLSEGDIDSITSLGLKTIGEVLALPRDGLARRYGPELTDYLARLVGSKPDAVSAYRSPPRYRRHFEMAGAIESFEGLLFPIRRILSELEGFLRGRDAAIQQLHLACGHERHPATILEIRSTQPIHDAGRLLMLVRERIERATLAAPVESLTVIAKRIIPVGDQQLDLLDGKACRDDAWTELMDRLRARLGDHAIRMLGLQSSYRPEKAWCTVESGSIESSSARSEVSFERPLWLIEAKPISRLPRMLGTPERIESGWWDGTDARRDYYIAETAEGARWWLYRDADSRQWYLHGLWA